MRPLGCLKTKPGDPCEPEDELHPLNRSQKQWTSCVREYGEAVRQHSHAWRGVVTALYKCYKRTVGCPSAAAAARALCGNSKQGALCFSSCVKLPGATNTQQRSATRAYLWHPKHQPSSPKGIFAAPCALLTDSCTGALASSSVLETSELTAEVAVVAAAGERGGRPPADGLERGGSAFGASAAELGPENGFRAPSEETAGQAAGAEALGGAKAPGGAEAAQENQGDRR